MHTAFVAGSLLVASLSHNDQPVNPKAPFALSSAEKKEVDSARCKPLTDAFTVAGKKAQTDPALKDVPMQDAILRTLRGLQRPAKANAADWTRCAALFDRDLRDYLGSAILDQGRSVVTALELGINVHFAEKAELCPAAPAVPAELMAIEVGTFSSTAASWTGPGWACVGSPGDGPQHFQLEVKSAAQDFEVIARGYPWGDGTLVTISGKGRVFNAKLQLDPIEVKSGAAPAAKPAPKK